MKKLILILGLAYMQTASAQSAGQLAATDTSIHSRLMQMEEKVSRQEEQLKALENESRLMKKDRSMKKSEARRKKVSISRQGSKQVVVE
jgi:hypothetical protein